MTYVHTDDAPDAADIASIALEVWASLGLDLAEAAEVEEDVLTASAVVRIHGSWRGELCLDCTGELARRLAAVMFAMDAELLETADVSDAVGELANILAGNTKSLLPEPSRLSTPEVALSVRLPRPRREQLLRVVPLRSFGLPMRITLWSGERS